MTHSRKVTIIILSIIAALGVLTAAAGVTYITNPTIIDKMTQGEPPLTSLPDNAVIVYSSSDGPIPEPGWTTITVTKKETKISVGSYGEEVRNDTVPTDPAVWQKLSDTVKDLTVVQDQNADPPCSGGSGNTGVTIFLADANGEYDPYTEPLLSSYTYNGGGGGYCIKRVNIYQGSLTYAEWFSPANAALY